MKNLLAPPTFDDVFRLLRAWRLWLFGALLGGLLGLAAYALFPPNFRARASVSVDFNVEQTWPSSPDREIFYFLDRETRKLEEIAWSDEVLTAVASQSGLELSALRAGVLTLSQPADGGWHFYADSADAALAAKMASAWAQAFAAAAQTAAPQYAIRPSQVENLPLARAAARGTYALAGAALAAAALALWALFRP
ncbi:MAG: hypothetical protein Fur0035_20870 [Anaerolineales bacterium]